MKLQLNGLGRPPHDPEKRKLWEVARAKRLAAKAKPAKTAALTRRIPKPVEAAPIKGSGGQPPLLTIDEFRAAVELARELKRIGLPADRLRAILGGIQSNTPADGADQLAGGARRETGLSATAGRQASAVPQGPETEREMRADLELAQQMIDDPVGFEQAMIDSHLRTGDASAAANDRQAESDL